MGRRSHLEQFVTALRSFDHERASFVQLAAKLGGDWTPERVEARARRFDADDAVSIQVVRGGVQCVGVENGARPGLYKLTRSGIEKAWRPDRSVRQIRALHTSRTSTRGFGRWSQPDLVAAVRRRAGANPPVFYLSIEVEASNGFGIESVYQAYEVGRGADYAWVFFEGIRPRENTWTRVMVAAHDLGVGIVRMPRPNRPSEWRTESQARRRTTDDADRDSFLRRAGRTPRDFDERFGPS